MRVLIAPDGFTGMLSALEAAEAIAGGWAEHAPGDELRTAPVGDAGAGFVSVLQNALGGELIAATVRGPLGEPTPVTVLRHGRDAYVEATQACGPQLCESLAVGRASSYGVGEAIAAAADAGAKRIVVGVGESVSNDGGAGMLAALGASADVALDEGPDSLAGMRSGDLSAARERCSGIELVLATDVETTLLGLFGTTKTDGPRRGVAEEDIPRIDGILDDYVVALCGSTPAQRRVADLPGAGAGGGIGFALSLLGAARASGIEIVADAAGLAELARASDVVVTGEAAFDFSSRAGTVVYGVAELAQQALRPCIVLAGRVDVGAREMRAMGIEAAYPLDATANNEQTPSDAAEGLRALAARVAGTWSR